MQLGSNSLDEYSKNLRRLFWVEFIEQQLDARYVEALRREAAENSTAEIATGCNTNVTAIARSGS